MKKHIEVAAYDTIHDILCIKSLCHTWYMLYVMMLFIIIYTLNETKNLLK